MLPVYNHSAQKLLWMVILHILIELLDILQIFADGHPVIDALLKVRGQNRLEADGAVDRALRNRISHQHPILRVAPCSFCRLEPFYSG
ncbi:hypothetical protein D3C79_963970 [compost metagenome]